MTREEQRIFQEANKAMDKAIKPACKKHVYKSVNGFIYRTVNDYLYSIITLVSFADHKNLVSANLYCKPLKLDEIFWNVFDMSETAKAQPFSFHVQGAYTAPNLRLDEWESPIASPTTIEQTMDAIFEQAGRYIASYSEKLKTIQDFKSMIVGVRGQKLNGILCDIAEDNYSTALEQIESALLNNETGGFVCASKGNGAKSIMEYAKEYCLNRM